MTVLVQTRLRPDMAAWLKGEAEREGESEAAWLRRLVYRAAGRAVLHAWVRPRGVDVLAVHKAGKAHDLDLEVIEHRSAVEKVCAVHLPDDKRPVAEFWYRGAALFQDPVAHCLVVKGCPWPCTVVGSVWDNASRRAELTINVGQQKGLEG